MIIKDISRGSVFLASLTLFLMAGFGYFMGVMFPPESEAATNPGTCLPVSKGGTGVCSEEDLLDKNYPIGSIYISTTSTNPADYLGGTWQAFGDGRTLVGMGSNGTNNYATVESTGGSDSVTLTTAQMPSHTHVQNSHQHDSGINRGNNPSTAGVGTGGYLWGENSGFKFTTWTTATNQNTGGGESHENRQSYITVYFWKRTS